MTCADSRAATCATFTLALGCLKHVRERNDVGWLDIDMLEESSMMSEIYVVGCESNVEGPNTALNLSHLNVVSSQGDDAIRDMKTASFETPSVSSLACGLQSHISYERRFVESHRLHLIFRAGRRCLYIKKPRHAFLS
ncbi:hypothetical protein BU24DRAFT_214538 [Aaosphaeria arxii CBS 175.79]|uniref:Uncharacterized protein n=1 Tax=Aaosphaeria arxii CBS 175.79 TaxID=1450172 RepID=A0A6A5XQ42_9PLEO|nr:uncharacterized protein BU24DRAFT_214538 [Aaosphaeria arxii CBS 175.79]KAF2014454.1 hypothetical protein BU24DRAFT_214538 [Aaosphaeria arxii CBS 175.79]